MKHVVLGAEGQLGRTFCRRLKELAIGLGRDEADLTLPESLDALLRLHRPTVVINCAAYNLVDLAEKHPHDALAVNFLGTANLARICAALDCLLVHFSTDYVFGRETERQSPYTEDDPPGPVNVYGHSKLAGEYAVRSLCRRHFIIRTCGLYGTACGPGRRANFVHTMLRLGREQGTVQVVGDQVCCPTFVDDLVDASLNLMTTEAYDVYHLTNAGSCSWHEFARTIFALAHVPAEAVGVTSAALARPAARPAYSVLDGSRDRRLGFAPLRPWQEALQSFLPG